MRPVMPLVLSILAALTAPAAADPLEIPLDTLPGAYPGLEAERTEAFAFTEDPGMIQAAFVHLRGSETAGTVWCAGEPQPYPMQVAAYMFDEQSGRWWLAGKDIAEKGGDFDVVLPFEGSPSKPPTWEFLADGEGVLYLLASPVDLVEICGPVLTKPGAVIEEVGLIFNLTSIAGAQPSTWGTLKALYR